VDRVGEPLGERARLARLLGVGPAQPQREADDHPLDVAIAHELGQAREAAPGGGPLDRIDGRRPGPGRVAERATAPCAAVIEGKHAHEANAWTRTEGGSPVGERYASAASIAARAAAIASGSLSGSRPPACAIVSRPPPPPP